MSNGSGIGSGSVEARKRCAASRRSGVAGTSPKKKAVTARSVPKPDGGTRPLGIAALEDRTVIKETRRERVAAELAALITEGLEHRSAVTALAVATTRRVQPFTHVGFKYHTVLALRTVQLTPLSLPDKECQTTATLT